MQTVTKSIRKSKKKLSRTTRNSRTSLKAHSSLQASKSRDGKSERRRLEEGRVQRVSLRKRSGTREDRAEARTTLQLTQYLKPLSAAWKTGRNTSHQLVQLAESVLQPPVADRIEV
jgi:hypothetical protein